MRLFQILQLSCLNRNVRCLESTYSCIKFLNRMRFMFVTNPVSYTFITDNEHVSQEKTIAR